MSSPVDSFSHTRKQTLQRNSLGLPRCRVILARIILLYFVACWPTQATPQGGSDVNDPFQLATTAMREGRLQEAAAGFENITHTAPTFVGAHFNLWMGREKRGLVRRRVREPQKGAGPDSWFRGKNSLPRDRAFPAEQIRTRHCRATHRDQAHSCRPKGLDVAGCDRTRCGTA